jgi:hypothetical protein
MASPVSAHAGLVDHLVVAAATLADGVAWCEATLGVTPGPGGKHPLFGTHNRLLKIESAAYPLAYLEIIAIDPEAPAPPRPRWFGLDDAALQRRLASEGPHLLHLVARTSALDAKLAALAAIGISAGEALAASRQAGATLLQWRIAVRPDGALQYRGALPTWIEWSSPHPAAAMPASPVALRGLALAGLAPPVAAALALDSVRCVAQADPPALSATFDTPRGTVVLESE